MRWYGGHYKVNGPPVNVPATLDQIIYILPCMPSELQLHPVKLKHVSSEYKIHYMYDMICTEIMSWVLSHGWNNTILDYRDITLNKQWYSDITSRQLSLQLDESDNHITVNEDAVLNQSLKNDKINRDIPKERWQSRTIHNRNRIYMTGTSDTVKLTIDTEVVEGQIAINKWQELTGDPLPSVLQFENLENKSNLSMCSWGKQHSQIYFIGQWFWSSSLSRSIPIW